MKLRFCSITFTVMVGSLGLAASASAEIVYLSSSRTISVKGHRVEGDSIILTLRNGGEVTCDKSLIEKIVSDEVPYPEPAGPEAVSQPPRSGADLPEETPYGEIIAAVSEAHGVDPLLVRALIQVESNYKPRAKSPRGRHGADAIDALDGEGIQRPKPVRSQGEHRGRNQASEDPHRPVGAPRSRWRPTTPGRGP